MFIQTEATPNPNALKFIPTGREVRGSKKPLFYKKDPVDNPEQDSPLAYNLFQIEGVEDVFFGSDFITIGKKASIEWPILKTPILSTLGDYLQSNHPVVIEDEPKPACEDINSDAGVDKVTKRIKQLIDEKVRPAVAMDGGDIIFHSYKEGTVYLEMHGACQGCPSSTATLKMGIENMLKHYIPEVRSVVAI
jgi:Fe-S cluster biogenesis protein NfuA